MSIRLSGINPLAYMGVEPISPPQTVVYQTRTPTVNDTQNVNLGTFWLVYETSPEQLWVLVSLAAGAATWVQLYPNSGTGASSFITDSGTANQAGGVLNVLGSGIVTTSGTGNTVTISASGTVPTTFTTQSGSAIPAAGVLTINGAGGVTTTASGSTVVIHGDGGTGGFTWNEVVGATQLIVIDNGYIANNSGGVSFTLPATATIGEGFAIMGKNAGGWSIAQNANQQIHFGDQSTTVGVTGFLASTLARDCIECVCTTSGSSTQWTVRSSIGNITVA